MLLVQEVAELVPCPGQVGGVRAVAPYSEFGERGGLVGLNEVEDSYPACEDVQDAVPSFGVVHSGRGGVEPLVVHAQRHVRAELSGPLDADEDRQELVRVDSDSAGNGLNGAALPERCREPILYVLRSAAERGVEDGLRLGAGLVTRPTALPVRHGPVADTQVRGEVPQAHAQSVA